jgi:hypothetical protein
MLSGTSYTFRPLQKMAKASAILRPDRGEVMQDAGYGLPRIPYFHDVE